MARGKVQRTKRGRVRRAKLSVEELERRLALARRAAQKVREDRKGLQPRLIAALEVAQQIATDLGYPSLLRTVYPPVTSEVGWRPPWVVVGKFTWRIDAGMSYSMLHEVLRAWQVQRLTRRIGGQRLSRMQIAYVTEKGDRQQYTLSEIGPWALMLARAIEKVDPDDDFSSFDHGREGSLAVRYEGSKVPTLYVWLSSREGFEEVSP